ncbi:MAG TPA: Flp pilus assembly protein CpaB [bacterium]|nr:Flp pilus assembly protein CpaB [bacterium]
MKDKKTLAALAAGSTAGLALFWFLSQRIDDYEKRSTPTEVLVATAFIPAQSVLRPDQVEKRKIPGAFIAPSAIQDLKEVAGLVTLAPLSAGEQVLSNKFGLPGNSLVLTLAPGRRALTLEVNEVTGVAGLLSPGDRVDLIGRLDTVSRQVTATVLQDIQVLAVGSTTGTGGGPAAPNAYDTVTLSLTPEQAELVSFLQERHALRLVLRPAGDDDLVPLPPQSDAELAAKIGTFTPSKAKGLEVIRGIETR